MNFINPIAIFSLIDEFMLQTRFHFIFDFNLSQGVTDTVQICSSTVVLGRVLLL